MLAGVVGGFLGGSDAFGMYAEYFDPGATPRGLLERGAFSMAARPSGDVPFVLLGAGGKPSLLDGDTGREAIAASVAQAVASGDLATGGKWIGGVRLQSPLSADGVGLVGFSVVGSEPLEILVRALGPSFSDSGAEDPTLSVYRLVDGDAIGLAPNDNWRDGAVFRGEDESAQGAFRALAEGFESLQLAPLADDARDAAQRVWLEPGDYLAVMQLVEGAAGSGLLEVLAL
jgi:hypothetical protein